MKKHKILFFLELKRMMQVIPSLMGGMAIFAAMILGLTMVSYGIQKGMHKNYYTYDVAIVQKEQDKYTDFAIHTVEAMDGMQNKFNFVEAEEEEALEGVKRGRYDVAFVIPERFIYDIMYGNETKIEIHYGGAPGTIVSYVISELSDIVAVYMEESEKSIFAVKDYMKEQGIPGVQKADSSLSVNYITRLLARNKIYFEKEVTATDNLSLETYYFCVGLILVFLLLGIVSAKLLSGYGKAFQQKLSVAGVGSVAQILARYFALLLCFSILYGGVTIVVGIVRPALLLGTIRSWWILFPIGALLMLVFELVENTANAILTLFVVIISLGFVSGFFFPLSMLPQAFDVFSGYTVTRGMLEYVKGCMIGNHMLLYFAKMMGHGVLFLIITILVRKIRNNDGHI